MPVVMMMVMTVTVMFAMSDLSMVGKSGFEMGMRNNIVQRNHKVCSQHNKARYDSGPFHLSKILKNEVLPKMDRMRKRVATEMAVSSSKTIERTRQLSP